MRSTARNDVKRHTEGNSPKYRIVCNDVGLKSPTHRNNCGEYRKTVITRSEKRRSNRIQNEKDEIATFRCTPLAMTEKRLRNKCAIVCDLFPRPFGERVRERGYLAAFTLAEVLITLGIIGVVAAMTMPSLIANYQKQQIVAQLKREYNVVSNALRAAQADNGDTENWELGNVGTIQSASDFADNYLLPYLTVLKKCGTDISGGCAYEYSYLNGASTSSLTNYARFILNDGAMVFVATESNPVFPKLIYINIDINGNKKPNKAGKDYFVFAVALETTEDRYKPTGRLNASGQSQTRENILSDINGCSKNARGIYCAALIIKDGWTISKDYPW